MKPGPIDMSARNFAKRSCSCIQNNVNSLVLIFQCYILYPCAEIWWEGNFLTDSMSQNSHAKIVDQNKCSLEVKANKKFLSVHKFLFLFSSKVDAILGKISIFLFINKSVNLNKLISAPQTNQGVVQSASSI